MACENVKLYFRNIRKIEQKNKSDRGIKKYDKFRRIRLTTRRMDNAENL